MRKLLATITLALAVSIMAAVPAWAETITSTAQWNVTFTSASVMETNFTAADIVEEVNGLQAGDTIKLTVNLKNDNSQTTNWYMTNKIIQSLEESTTNAKGGAYEYKLVYVSPTGERNVLFSSESVGGDVSQNDREGLHEATGALEDYFLLGPLTSGQSARVLLDVTLDGETQGNSYQDTLATLALDFAVEPVDAAANNTPVRTPSTLPQMGDVLKTLPLVITCGVAGVIMLIAGILAFRRRKDDEKEVA